MMQIDVYNQSGKKVSSKDLPEALFGVHVHEGLIHQALVRQMSNVRYNLAKAKTRAEVRGGGRKPFKQKGMGRSRQGSIRSPQWKGGGVVFGPTGEENYTKNMPKKQRRLALFSALSLKAHSSQVFGLEGYTGSIASRDFRVLLSKLPVERNVLFVLPESNEVFEKSARNFPNVKYVLAHNVNVYDVVHFQNLCLLGDADKVLESVFLNA